MPNQNPEQLVRDNIDRQLIACGWLIQSREELNLYAGVGIAVKEYPTDIGPADYVLFVDKKPVGVIEAKKEEEGFRITSHEPQSEGYATCKLKHLKNDPLPFVYESTGEVTRFKDFRDPKPRSRPVFTFHRPETLRKWLQQDKSLRKSLIDLPPLKTDGLRDCQVKAITALDKSFKEARPRALIQMATGSGKTFTAITFIYRLLKFTNAKRILFLVDTKNLGEQAEQEFMSYLPNDDDRKFTELYGVNRLKSGYVPGDNQVYISTIQRLYSILKGTELDEAAEEENPNEKKWQPKAPMPVVYNEKIPIEFFDFIVIDECHRSIYNLWKQVLEYFDAFQIGLTATPDNRTFGYFNQNIVSEYNHEQAVIDGVNVGHDVYLIETKITQHGAKIEKEQYIEHREKLSRKKRWEMQDEAFNKLHDELKEKAPEVFTGQLSLYIDNVRRVHEQIIDSVNPDFLLNAGNATDNKEKAEVLIADFKAWIEQHKDEIIALQIFYSQPVRRRELTYKMIQDVLEKLKLEKPNLAPFHIWKAYEQLDASTSSTRLSSPKSELIALVSLIRRVTGIDATLTNYSDKVDLNFRDWILKKNAGQHNRFTEEQMQWLRMIKDHIATSIHLDTDDLDYTPFDAAGGKGKMYQLFGGEMSEIINEINEVLSA